MMVRVRSLALAAMVLCAVLAITTGTINPAYFVSLITSSFTFVTSSFASAAGLTLGFWRRVLTSVISLVTSSFNSAIGLSLEFGRRILTTVSIDHALKVRARDFAIEQIHTFHHAAKALLVPYISVCRHIVTDAIGEYPLLRLAEEYLRPQPSGLPADFNPHTDTLFLLLATNFCTAIFCLFIGAAILAPLRTIWRITKALASLADKPEATWQTFLDRLTPALAHTAAFGVNVLVFCGTGLFFCGYSIAMYAADLVTGYLMKRRASKAEPPKVFYRNLPDPRVPELEDQVCKLKSELEDKSSNWNSKFREDALTISGLMEENDKLENANMAQKLAIKKYWSMQASIDMTRPMHEQLMETRKQRDDAQGNYERIVEEKKAMETNLWTQLGKKVEEIRDLKFSHRARMEEYAALKRSQEYHQDRARKDGEASKLSIEFQKGRVQELEKLMASEKDTLDARVKELLATIESLEAQLKERDELIKTQKEAIQSLEAQKKELETRHLSEQKAQKAHLMEAFERERSKLTNLSRLSSEARKAAEEKYKAADEARKAADEAHEAAEQARKTEEEARKIAEKDSAANLEARKTAEEAYKAAEEKRKVAEGALEAAEKAHRAAEEESAANLKALNAAQEALKIAEEARKAAEDESASLRVRLANRPPSHDKGTQASSPPPSPRMKTPGSPSTTPSGSPPSSPRKTPPSSPRKTPGSPGTTPPGSPGQAPPPSPPKEAPPSSSKGMGPCPPIGQRPILPARSVNRKPKSSLSSANSGGNNGLFIPNVSSFSFNFLGGATPNIPGTNPGAPSHGPKTPPPPAAPSNPGPTNPPAAPSTPEPKTPLAEPSAPAPSTPEPKTPQAAPSTPEPENLPALPSSPEPSTPEPANLPALPSSPEPSTPEPTSPPAGPSSPEPTTPPAASQTESSPGKTSGGSSESKQPEPVNTTPAEGSPAEPAMSSAEPSAEPSGEPSGEPTEAPEPGSA